MTYDDEYVYQNNMLFDGTDFYLKSNYLKSFSIGMHEIILSTSTGNYLINLNITNSSNPYLVSLIENYIAYIYTFELFDGTILSIDGNNITSDDYQINDNRVLINYSFINDIFENDQEKESFNLSYSIEKGNDLFISSFTIYRP